MGGEELVEASGDEGFLCIEVGEGGVEVGDGCAGVDVGCWGGGVFCVGVGVGVEVWGVAVGSGHGGGAGGCWMWWGVRYVSPMVGSRGEISISGAVSERVPGSFKCRIEALWVFYLCISESTESTEMI